MKQSKLSPFYSINLASDFQPYHPSLSKPPYFRAQGPLCPKHFPPPPHWSCHTLQVPTYLPNIDTLYFKKIIAYSKSEVRLNETNKSKMVPSIQLCLLMKQVSQQDAIA